MEKDRETWQEADSHLPLDKISRFVDIGVWKHGVHEEDPSSVVWRGARSLESLGLEMLRLPVFFLPTRLRAHAHTHTPSKHPFRGSESV